MAEDPCLPALNAGHPGGVSHVHHHAHRVVGRITRRVHGLAPNAARRQAPASVACGRPEGAAGGDLPAMPAGRGLPRMFGATGKAASLAKTAAMLAAVGLAGAGAATLSGSPSAPPVTTHLTGVPSDPGGPPMAVPSGRSGDPGAGRVAVPEPPSFLLVLVAAAGVLGIRSLARRRPG